MIPEQKQDLPLTYRKEVVKPILDWIDNGESCSVVGYSSVGKSNLLRFLHREDVRHTYLNEEARNYLFVYVDLNKQLQESIWGLLELMLHQLLVELTTYGANEASLRIIDELHQRATEPKTRYLALRYLDRAIGMVCTQLQLNLVFLIDEFDGLCRTMSPRGFSALRALRDDYKYRLMYVVATRLELRRLRTEQTEIEAFEELVTSHTIWLGPYLEDDARFALQRLEARHRTPLNDKITNEIIVASGRHPGLLREMYHLARQDQKGFVKAVTTDLHVADECRRIWLSLTPEEQETLLKLTKSTAKQSLSPVILDQLRRKGLVDTSKRDYFQIFSPTFIEFTKGQNPTAGIQIHIDHNHHTVWVDGHEVQRLTSLEYKLISYLVKKRGQVCSRDELVQYLYPEDMTLEGQGVSDNRLDSVLKRLRKQIEPNPKEPRYIVTVRGHGFRLVD